MRSKIVSCISFFVVFVLGGLTMYGVISFLPVNNSTDSERYSSPTGTGKGTTLGSQSYEKTVIVNNSGISESVNKAYDSVVMIENYKKNTLVGTGSGFVYKTDTQYGYIMTNQHVVDGATSIKILFANDIKVDGKVLGKDKYLDIAVVRVDVKYVLSKLSVGNTENLKRGEEVFAIGSPVGVEYFNTITSGIISGLDRKVTVSVDSTDDWIQEVIQVDAAINPGNSGGPLLNTNGEVIGVNSMKLVDEDIEGIGFAIKIEDVMKHVAELEKGQEIERPYLGISHIDIAYASRYGIDIDDDIESGIAIVEVVEGSSADKAGLKKGDVIIALGDDKVTSTAYLKYLLYKYNIGDKVEFTYIRDGKEQKTTITLVKNED